MFGLEYSDKFDNNQAEVTRCAEFLNDLSVRTAGSGR
jgi:hypothetical protein